MSIQNKHLLNTPASLVLDSLEGLCALNPQLTLDSQNTSVFIASPDRSKVALLCGGGSGHEPAHAAFVGRGILTGAVCGNIFASPNASQVGRAIDFVDNEKGTVIIVKNYTGDVLNFGLAKEQYASLHPEKANRVRFVIVGDDVAVGKSQGAIVGRRGLAGTVLIYKIAGALANRGASLDEVYDIAQSVAANIVTIGVGLEHCHVPGTAPGNSHLSPAEIEIGMGIHNETGNRRVSPVPPLNELIPQLLNMLTSETDSERSFLSFEGGNNGVVLLINNLGGLSSLEMGAIANEARKAAKSTGLNVERILCGSFMTSLNMPGFSITLFRLPTEGAANPSKALVLSLLDERCDAPGWGWSSGAPASTQVSKTDTVTAQVKTAPPLHLTTSDDAQFLTRISRACKALIAAEPEITQMDNIAGDGDCGLTLVAGASAVLDEIKKGTMNDNDVVGSVIVIARVAEEAMGGTSGALYSIFFSALAQGLQSQSLSPGVAVTPQIWTQALKEALNKLYNYTRARPPSRTLVDPLAAFVTALSNDPHRNLGGAVKAAAEAAEATRNIEAKAGRSAYIDGDRLRKEKVADPGAWGVKTILEGLKG